ncbi:hypothetical protein ZWY2020_042098 [Hordeum vulgare]|nr:hypothetical protein ZWY2020_042098 [Hordeum vulgare]
MRQRENSERKTGGEKQLRDDDSGDPTSGMEELAGGEEGGLPRLTEGWRSRATSWSSQEPTRRRSWFEAARGSSMRQGSACATTLSDAGLAGRLRCRKEAPPRRAWTAVAAVGGATAGGQSSSWLLDGRMDEGKRCHQWVLHVGAGEQGRVRRPARRANEQRVQRRSPYNRVDYILSPPSHRSAFGNSLSLLLLSRF